MQSFQNLRVGNAGVRAGVTFFRHIVVGNDDVFCVEVLNQIGERGGCGMGAVFAFECGSVHFSGNAEHFGLLPSGDVLNQMVGIAVLARIIRRVDVNDIGGNAFDKFVCVLVVAVIVL